MTHGPCKSDRISKKIASLSFFFQSWEVDEEGWRLCVCYHKLPGVCASSWEDLRNRNESSGTQSVSALRLSDEWAVVCAAGRLEERMLRLFCALLDQPKSGQHLLAKVLFHCDSARVQKFGTKSNFRYINPVKKVKKPPVSSIIWLILSL